MYGHRIGNVCALLTILNTLISLDVWAICGKYMGFYGHNICITYGELYKLSKHGLSLSKISYTIKIKYIML